MNTGAELSFNAGVRHSQRHGAQLLIGEAKHEVLPQRALLRHEPVGDDDAFAAIVERELALHWHLHLAEGLRELGDDLCRQHLERDVRPDGLGG